MNFKDCYMKDLSEIRLKQIVWEEILLCLWFTVRVTFLTQITEKVQLLAYL